MKGRSKFATDIMYRIWNSRLQRWEPGKRGRTIWLYKKVAVEWRRKIMERDGYGEDELTIERVWVECR